MPKTSRPRRQSLSSNDWTSSADSSQSYQTLTAPRARYYGRRLPPKKPARVRFDSSPSLDGFSPRKRRHTPLDTMRANDSSDGSSDDESLADKTPHASRVARRSIDSAPSYPAFTPIIPWAKRVPSSHSRATIRVNLTPTRDDAPRGWCTKSQLLGIAKRHDGMAIQYRVMYHASQKAIYDHNPGKRCKIRFKDLVVQSRFACASGSYGGNTHSFMRWKLPGTLLQSRNAKHITIYDDTRPKLFEPGQKETSHPLILLCGELKEEDRRMVERFLRQAEAGMTPEMFYSHNDKGMPNRLEKSNGNVLTDSVEGESTEEHLDPLIQDGDVDDVSADCDDGETENEVVQKKQTPHTSDISSCKDKLVKLQDCGRPTKQSSSIPESGSKRKRGSEDTAKAAKLFKKKAYGGDRHRHHKKITFHVGGNDSPQFLALVEGVVEETAGTGGPEEVAQDYIRDIFMNGRVENLPSSGRLLELPGDAKPGSWTGEVVDTMDRRGTRTGMIRDKIRNLKFVRILLRHDSAEALGPLNFTPRDDSLSPLLHSGDNIQRIRGGGCRHRKQTDSLGRLTVSLVDPSHSRRNGLISQDIVAKDAIEPFIGSISIASFDGFTSSADACILARKVSSSLLEGCRKNAIDMEKKGLGSSSLLEDVLPIPANGKPNLGNGHNVGVSFVCKVEMNDTYGLLVAHDDIGRIVAVDVVFDQSVFQGRSSLSSTSTSRDEPTKLTKGVLRRHSEDMGLVSSKKSIDLQSMYSESNTGIIVDNDHLESSLPGSSVEYTRDDDVNEETKAITVTWDPEGSKNDDIAHVESDVPGTISKQKRNATLEVTPAHILQATKIDVEGQSTARLPFVTPTPARVKQTEKGSVGFLARLEQVADYDAESVQPGKDDRNKEYAGGFLDDAVNYEFDSDALDWVADNGAGSVHSGQVDRNQECHDDLFDVAIDSELVAETSAPGSNSRDSASCVSASKLIGKDDASSGHSARRWPSIHDVFYGLHDESEHVECTSEEIQAICLPATPTGLFSKLHGFFFDPDDDTVPSQAPAVSARRTIIRRSFLSTVRVFVIAFVSWQLTLVRHGNEVEWTMLPQKSFTAVGLQPVVGRNWNSEFMTKKEYSPVENLHEAGSSWGSYWAWTP